MKYINVNVRLLGSILKIGSIYSSKEIKEYVAKNDLKNVLGWIHQKTSMGELRFEYSEIPILKLSKQISEMEKTLSDFKKDKRRVEKILKQYENGDTIYPVYIEKDDIYNFIIEGRHRVIAMKMFGLKSIPVFYVFTV